MTQQRQMKLGAFLYPTGHHIAGWRHPEAQADAGINFQHYVEIAREAERGKFDLVFMADGNSTKTGKDEALSRVATRYVGQFEPITLLSALAAVTERIGFVATASTTYNEPYHVARKFASLDHISGGRAGWNLVTSAEPNEALNFSKPAHPDPKDRYERAEEFADVVKGLWDSFEDDAFLRDKESGIFFDPEKRHVLNHAGRHFQVRGPLNVPRSPQGQPVLVQAGSSEPGKELAARTAELVFTAQRTVEDAVAFYNDLKGRMEKYGRHPDALKIMPGAFPVVGRTRAEAEDKFATIQSYIHPVVGLDLLSATVGMDLSQYDPDGPVPEVALPSTMSSSRKELVLTLARRRNLTIRELYLEAAGARGHWQLIGTASEIADQLEEYFLAGGSDGFNIMPPILPTGLTDFVDLVIPELQRRGLFRTEYECRTLRENLGLKRPVNRIGGQRRNTIAAE